MSVKCLAEAIILQSVADLWTESEREDSITFLTGDGFKACSEMAGMGISERIKLLTLASDAMRLTAEITKDKKKLVKRCKYKTKKPTKDSNKDFSAVSH